MKTLKNLLLGTAIIAGAGYLLYRYVLDDDTKQYVDEAVNIAKDAAGRIQTAAGSLQERLQEEQIIPTKEQLQEQWKKLGF